MEQVSGWILLTGTVAFVASVPVGIGLAIWFWTAGVDADGNPTYDLVVRAELPGRPALRRTLGWGSGDSSGPDDRWAGRAIRLRHNTLDPDDEHDALFDGWPDDRQESYR
ncbi:hypothetical protein ACFVFD_31470 [Streptomyces fimicarius]|uniref:hypothetical protein n=1 Tax=Streptomyces griseus TaxID=1911 RepID=UPI00367A1B41